MEAEELAARLARLSHALRDAEEAGVAELRQRISRRLGEASASFAVTVTECHLVDFVKRGAPTNASTIADALGMTRGGVSKLAARLVAKGVMLAGRHRHNQKDILYSLTPLGEEVFRAHAEAHKKARRRIASVLKGYTPTETALLGDFLDKLANTLDRAASS